MIGAMRSLVLAVTLLVPAVASAEATVTITLSQEGQAFAAALGKTPAELAAELKQKVDDAYQTANVDGFLRAFTDATAFSQRGIGVDYAAHPENIIFGIAGNVAAASDSVVEAQERPTAGATVNFAAMVGVNLASMDLPRLTLFGNGFYQGASTDKLNGTITSVGAHAQYRIISPQVDKGAAVIARWLGLDLTAGVEYTRWKLGATNIKNTYQLAGDGGQSATVNVDSTGNFDLATNAVTVPVELTTGVRLAYIASLYIGAGFDFTVGKSEVTGNLNGDILSEGGDNIGTVALTANGSSSGSPAAGRILAGAQLNLWKLKVFVQGNVSQTPAASVAFGLRLVL